MSYENLQSEMLERINVPERKNFNDDESYKIAISKCRKKFEAVNKKIKNMMFKDLGIHNHKAKDVIFDLALFINHNVLEFDEIFNQMEYAIYFVKRIEDSLKG